MRLQGIAASPGIAIGTAWVYDPRPLAVPRWSIEPDQVSGELARLDDALARATAEIQRLRERTAARAGADEAAIFDAHLAMLADPAMLEAVQTAIREQRMNAEAAVWEALEQYRQMLASLPDEYLSARAVDLEDIRQRLLAQLLGHEQMSLADLTSPVILVAPDLTPSDTAAMDAQVVLGIATEQGGRTSHTAILARKLGIPAVVGVRGLLASIGSGAITVAVDGETGTVVIAPTEADLAALEAERAALVARQVMLQQLLPLPAETRDGHRIELAANVGGIVDARAAAAAGASGIGLFRTEFLFLERDNPPGEDEQVAAYTEVADLFPGQTVIIRTLDIGGDKQVPYLRMPTEANPFLGVRGLRLCLEHTELFKIQLRALWRAAAKTQAHLRVMFPMVATREELVRARGLVQEAREEVGLSAHDGPDMLIGIMGEIPAAALTIDLLADVADFFSVGTNDLVQYAQAADRMNAGVGYLQSAFHPAVLRLLRVIAEAARASGRWLGMCGEMAGDPLATPLLVGLGFDELSMQSTSLLAVKRIVRALTMDQAREIAAHALSLRSAAAVEGYLRACRAELEQEDNIAGQSA
jgi:phosphoenolpyruvate-protein phosphotransferase